MKSPYFQKRARSEIPTEQRSCYFRKSPVSCYGTIERLGPLIFVLSNEDYPCGNSSCQNTPQCSACSTVINDAISHFYMCETFRISYESVLSEIRRWKVSDRLTCWEEADTAIQRSVRHLCPCRCYLRAFAPFREWLSLRRHLHALVDSPLDTLFHGWRCKLDYNVGSVSLFIEETDANKMDKRLGPLPRVVFVSPDGKRFFNKTEVVKVLVNQKMTSTAQFRGTVERLPVITPSPNRKMQVRNKKTYQAGLEEDNLASDDALMSWYISNQESPLGLLEELFCDDPWRLLISTIFLNRTSRVQVDVVLYNFLERWPTAADVAVARPEDIGVVISPIGMRDKRARGLIRFSNEYLQLLEARSKVPKQGQKTTCYAYNLSEKDILSLYHCGDYAFAAYKLFIRRDTRTDHEDHALHSYAEYQRAKLNTSSLA